MVALSTGTDATSFPRAGLTSSLCCGQTTQCSSTDSKAGLFSIEIHPCLDNELISDSNYSEKKIEENIDSEIMQVILEEAQESYDPEIVIELQSDDVDQMESNVERITQWVENWKANNSS